MAAVNAKITTLEKTMEEMKDELALLRNRLAKMEAIPAAKTEKKEKKERKPRGATGWSLFANKVRGDMKAANPDKKFTAADSAKEASRLKSEGKYDEAHWKALAEKMKASGTAPSASEVEVSATEPESDTSAAKATKKVAKKVAKKD